MPNKADKTLQLAIDALTVVDVYLHSNRTHYIESFDPKSNGALDELQIQQLHQLHQIEVLTLDNGQDILRIRIELGARWIRPIENTEPEVVAVIEASFIAEYTLKHEIPEKSIKAFAQQNASYHIWPYWREFLSSQCERMRLPRVVLPTTQVPRSNKQK